MSDELDDFDRKILQCLAEDGRTPVAQVAERIGLSRPAVAERIDKLERSGVICGTTVVVDPRILGNEITAFVFARRNGMMDAAGQKEFRSLVEREEIAEVHTVAGDDCYLIKVRTHSIDALNDIVSSLHHSPMSLSTRTTIVMKTHFEKVGGVTLGVEGSR